MSMNSICISIHPSIRPSVHPSVYLSYQCIYINININININICLSLSLSSWYVSRYLQPVGFKTSCAPWLRRWCCWSPNPSVPARYQPASKIIGAFREGKKHDYFRVYKGFHGDFIGNSWEFQGDLQGLCCLREWWHCRNHGNLREMVCSSQTGWWLQPLWKIVSWGHYSQ